MVQNIVVGIMVVAIIIVVGFCVKNEFFGHDTSDQA